MDALLLATVLLLLPGLAILYCLNVQRHRYLLAVGLSYALYAASLWATSRVGLDAAVFTAIYLVAVVILVTAAFALALYRHGWSQSTLISVSGKWPGDWLPPLVIATATGIYLWLVGPYLEIPSDVYQHFEFIQDMFQRIEQSIASDGPLSWYLLRQNGKYWHLLYAFLAHWTGHEPQQIILPVTFLTSTLFLLGVYRLATVVYADLELSAGQLAAVAAVTTLFVVLHFGINMFSYVRYYALAPTMVNYVLYFAVMAVAVDFFRGRAWEWRYLVIAMVVLYASAYIHRQEALFAIVMTMMMGFVLFAQRGWAPAVAPAAPVRSAVRRLLGVLSDKINLAALLSAALFVGYFIYAYATKTRGFIPEPKIIPLEVVLPFVKHLYILNPTYQFYYVLTLWGVYVYAVFFVYRRWFRGNFFILAGMLSPLLTIFNPFFVDLFLRSGPGKSMWRLSYLVPLHFVAGYLAVRLALVIRDGHWRSRLGASLALAPLLLLLFPVNLVYIDAPYSRLHTLMPVARESSPALWRDLLDYLESLPERETIITDPVTGYVVSGLTRHVSYRHKFHRRRGYVEFNHADYAGHPLDAHAGKLLIINQRDGEVSQHGAMARHWPDHILKVSNYYYAEGLEPYLQGHPERFELLWEEDRIRVYRILAVTQPID